MPNVTNEERAKQLITEWCNETFGLWSHEGTVTLHECDLDALDFIFAKALDSVEARGRAAGIAPFLDEQFYIKREWVDARGVKCGEFFSVQELIAKARSLLPQQDGVE